MDKAKQNNNRRENTKFEKQAEQAKSGANKCDEKHTTHNNHGVVLFVLLFSLFLKDES